MKEKLIITCLPILFACATEVDRPLDEAPAVAPEVSSAVLQVEQAERMLDRGQDAAEAKRLIEAALASGELTADEASAASLALSRALETLGDIEPAIAVLERELPTRGRDSHHPTTLAVRERLRELVTGSREKPGPSFVPDEPAPNFARLLSGYFPPAPDGQISARLILVGGDPSISAALGTFDVGAGRRAVLEAECPLCESDLSVHQSVSRSDWLIIPARRDDLERAFVAFYYDLQKNRIPARYEALLPLEVADIERELRAGRSFIAATERPGAPPMVLLAAPRTAMLEDVERELATMSALPTEPVVVEVSTHLRPKEIQAVIRGAYFTTARSCYEDLRALQPDARGKIELRFAIGADGAVTRHTVDVKEGDLEVASFNECLDAGLSALRFPAIGGETTVTYPMTFTPR